jgi:ureidoglycolate hydrolase
MDDQLLTISEYHGEGYQPLVDFGAWRVAVLRWEPGSRPEAIEYFERHIQTDEVFILLEGWATILIGGNQENADKIQAAVMEMGKLYNVRQNTWHSALLSRDALLLIVENCDTGKANSEFFPLTAEQKQDILGLEYRQ